MNHEPIIRPVPTEERFRELVDVLIPPEAGYNDTAVKAFIDIVLTVANPEDNYSWGLANAAARHAFIKSETFEQAFHSFANWPSRAPYKTDRYTVVAPKEV